MATRSIPQWYGLQFGADPELFISREVGKVRKRKAIIGSELVIPKDGLHSGSGSVARDGVQVELHPIPSTCRASFSSYLQSTISLLDTAVRKVNAKDAKNGLMKIDFTQLVKVTKGDLAKLTPDSRRLGCMPSFNAYGRKQIDKNGETFLTRSAAGHLHFGTSAISQNHVDPNVYAKVCDMVIGNTCVMIDRSPFAAERRRVYGKAGEYRLPKHGIEYRTLSNFWLHNYVLMSMVFGLARTAHDVACTTTKVVPGFAKTTSQNYLDQYIPNAADMLMKDVDQAAVERAINTNDWELARQNYEKWLKPFLMQVTYGASIGLDAYLIKDFDFFLDQIRRAELSGSENPLNVWFPEDPLQHWLNKPDGHGRGFESFMQGTVKIKRPKQFSGLVMLANKVAEPTQAPLPGIIEEKPATGARIVN